MAIPCCTIEMEPRTLSQGQITHARAAAVDIVQKKEPDEASNIFMEGLKPDSGIKELVQNVHQKGDSIHRVVEEKTDIIIGTSCQCSCTSSIMDSPDDLQLKEPLSAPF